MEQKSFQVHTVPVFPAILASLHPASGAMPTSCCFQDRKGKHRLLLCAATRPPATSPTSAAHPKLARASTSPRLSLQQGLPLQPSSAVQREAPTPQFLLWISFRITPASPLPSIITTPTHPHTYCKARGNKSLPASRERENRPPLFPPAHSQRPWRYMIHPSSLPLGTPKAWKHSHFFLFLPPPPLASSNEAAHLMRSQKMHSWSKHRVEFPFVPIGSLNSRLSGSDHLVNKEV